MKTFMILCMSALLLPAFCGCVRELSASVQGNGQQVTEERQASGFTELESSGAIDVNVTAGETFRVSVTADSNLIPRVKTEVDGKTLKIYTDQSYSTHHHIRVDVVLPRLDRADMLGSGDLVIVNDKTDKLKVNVSGSSDVRIKNLTAGLFDVSIDGSGDVTVQGSAQVFRSMVNGSGDIKATDLKTRSASVEINGSGDARIHASDSVTALVNGSGDILYSGTPRFVDRSISGSGSINAVK